MRSKRLLRRYAAWSHAVRWGRVTLLLTPLALVLAVVLTPEGRLACTESEAREASPDGAWTLTLAADRCGSQCRTAPATPGWVVLRDRAGAIRGVTGLGMVQMYSGETDWRPDRVDAAPHDRDAIAVDAGRRADLAGGQALAVARAHQPRPNRRRIPLARSLVRGTPLTGGRVHERLGA